MKKSIFALVIILLGMNFTSCTVEAVDDVMTPTLTDGDKKNVVAPPEED